MDIDKVIEKRHSVTRFTTKEPDWRKIIEAIDAANKSPLAGNLSCLRFILVNDKGKISKIADACQQEFVADVNYLVVVCSDKKQLKINFPDRADMYSRQQAGAAIENFLLKIEDLKLASCWVGAFVDHIVKRILTIPDNVDVEAILPVGFEMPPKSKQKKKPVFDSVMYFNQFGKKRLTPLIEPDAE